MKALLNVNAQHCDKKSCNITRCLQRFYHNVHLVEFLLVSYSNACLRLFVVVLTTKNFRQYKSSTKWYGVKQYDVEKKNQYNLVDRASGQYFAIEGMYALW